MDLKSILDSPPKVHNWGTGELIATGLPTPVFEFMDRVLSPNSISIETGMGISTAVFAIKGGKHICVNPVQSEINRFKDYCEKKDINPVNIEFICKRSDEVWFDLQNHSWDFILIDGGHGFPIPFMDWYFLSQGLIVDGFVIIDDTHISTGHILKQFLLKEDAWKIVSPINPKTAIFQKVKEFNYNKEWDIQPFIVQETKKLAKSSSLFDIARSLKRKLMAKR